MDQSADNSAPSVSDANAASRWTTSVPSWGIALICFALVAATFAAYWPVRNNQFTDFDDPGYVTANRHVLAGLKPAEVRWVFTHFYFYNYHPVTLLSHMLDVQLFGPNPGAHHLSSVALHALDAVLLFMLLLKMTGAAGRSAFVAAAFALHPLHVESVAWVAERKDVLSTLFWILTMFAYVAYVRRPSLWRYALVIVWFVLGLLSKPMLVTLPFVLLLIDYWPLQRTAGWRTLILEKLPLIALAAACCVITVKAQGVAVATSGQLPLAVRLTVVPLAYCRYIGKMIWPANLAVLYPIPIHINLLPVFAAAIIVIAATIAAWLLRKRAPYLTVGWFWYLGTLIPVIGIVQVGAQSMADRYTYVPLIGLFIAIAWSVWAIVMRLSSPRAETEDRSAKLRASAETQRPVAARWQSRILIAATIILLLGWCAVTRAQLKYWKTSQTLFARAVEVEPDNPIILHNIGWELARSGKVHEAISWYVRALELSKFPDVYTGLGAALLADSRPDDAVRIIEQGIAHFPEDSNLQRTAGAIYDQRGDLPRAQQHLAESVRLDPSNIVAHQLLAGVYLRQEHYDQALAEAQRVLDVLPNDPDSLFNLASVLAAQGKPRDAIAPLRELLNLRPQDSEAHFQLALALAATGSRAESLTHLRDAIRLKPDYGVAINNLAWTLATDPNPALRNGPEAVRLAEHAAALPGGDNPALLDTLAAAYAEAGQFADAVKTTTRAAAMADQQSSAPLAAAIRQREQMYRQGKAFRDPPQ